MAAAYGEYRSSASATRAAGASAEHWLHVAFRNSSVKGRDGPITSGSPPSLAHAVSESDDIRATTLERRAVLGDVRNLVAHESVERSVPVAISTPS